MSLQLRGDTCSDLFLCLFSGLDNLFFFYFFMYFISVSISLSLSLSDSIHISFSLSLVAFTLHQGGDYHSKSIDLLSVCTTPSNYCVCWMLCKSHTNRQGQREWVPPGSEFSKGLLLVVVWCQNTVNGPLISFKRLKGPNRKTDGLFYIWPVDMEARRWAMSHKFKFRLKKVKEKVSLFTPPFRELSTNNSVSTS